ncbi:MAG TPA: type II toxin-antitoxin system HicB family antitoxin [Candidatus Lokiarchaeia archaeon]|nr:type II toxin-antitoxin system HicB family antitoxin [Candidatus Lokiarchaeia archaeon]
MYRYLIVVEKAGYNFSVYAPDLPGCVATGKTREEAESKMHDAIEMHLHGLVEDHVDIPEPQASAEYVIIKSLADVVEN